MTVSFGELEQYPEFIYDGVGDGNWVRKRIAARIVDFVKECRPAARLVPPKDDQRRTITFEPNYAGIESFGSVPRGYRKSPSVFGPLEVRVSLWGEPDILANGDDFTDLQLELAVKPYSRIYVSSDNQLERVFELVRRACATRDRRKRGR
jgi:hypothetical protein